MHRNVFLIVFLLFCMIIIVYYGYQKDLFLIEKSEFRKEEMEMKEFLLGVNYWASHAGVDMWRDWREDMVERDLEILSRYGVNTLRVFPNWKEFQCAEPMLGGDGKVREYRLAGDRLPENPWYLEERMLERFSVLCRIAQKYHIKLIVGLLTGWMSGRLFVPVALYEKNIFTDPLAQYFAQLFVKGFVERMKEEPAIYAWDLGNECNCMGQPGSREAAYSWSSMVVNAIRACDQSRPIISGMHSLELEGVWNIQDQGQLTDMLTTHPYPFWVEHAQLTPLNSFRTLLHATGQTQYYATVGGKPCLVEELGSMGPMNLVEDLAAGFLKTNLWSNWAHGAPGVLWWCAFDQSELTAPPYDWNMFERELGMVDTCGNPKPVLLQMKQFSRQLQELDLDLPAKTTDGVCILSWGQDHAGIAFMSFLLAKQAGLTLAFSHCDQPIPESDLYFLPSVHTDNMSRRRYMELKQKIFDGATLYISVRDGTFTEFEALTGFRVITAAKAGKRGYLYWENEKLPYAKPHKLQLEATRAEVLALDEAGEPAFGVATYGKGKVYFLNLPLEEMLLTDENGFDAPWYGIYETVASPILEGRNIRKSNPKVGLTLHGEYAVLVNYSAEMQDSGLSTDADIEYIYGNPAQIPGFDAAIVRITELHPIY